MKNKDKFLKQLKFKLEQTQKFKYWNSAIGICWEDFEIIELNNYLPIKKGKKDIGIYAIFLRDGVVDSIAYDMNNEYVRKHNLEEIKNVK